MTKRLSDKEKQERALTRAFIRDPNDPRLRVWHDAMFPKQQHSGSDMRPPWESQRDTPLEGKAEAVSVSSTALIFDATNVKPAIALSSRLEEALALAALGFAVFPCEQGGKRPVGRLVPNGCKNATVDPNTIRSWWSSGDWNIGIATGSGLIILDVDPDNGGDESMSRLVAEHGPLPQTVMSRTGGGGSHVFFTAPAGAVIGCSASAIAPGLDIRGAGGYGIVPPSEHANGRPYEWLAHPRLTPIAQMPDWLAGLCRGMGEYRVARPQGFWANAIQSRVPEGQRNHALTRLAGYLFWRAVDRDVILELVWSWNRTHCEPPLGDDEVLKIVFSIYRREQQRREGGR